MITGQKHSVMEGYIPPSYHMKYVRFNYDCIAAVEEGFSLPSSHWRIVWLYRERYWFRWGTWEVGMRTLRRLIRSRIKYCLSELFIQHHADVWTINNEKERITKFVACSQNHEYWLKSTKLAFDYTKSMLFMFFNFWNYYLIYSLCAQLIFLCID